jgi:hypothetical protein
MPGLGVLRLVIAASVVSTAVHYADNYVAIGAFPQPDWIDRPSVIVTWVALTAVGLLGYVLYRRGSHPAAELCLAVYSVTGISTLGHYLSPGAGDIELWRNVSIVSDGLVGLSVLAFAVWSVLARPGPRTAAAA